MKKLLFIFVTLLCLLGINGQKAIAQTNSFQVYDSIPIQCSPPGYAWFYGAFSSYSYATGDTITYYINFGDGTDTTIIGLIYSNVYSSFAMEHTYLTSGYYTTQFIATGPNGVADTIVVIDNVFVGNTCGNLEGRVYLDNNSDCIYNSGDDPLDLVGIQAASSGSNPFYLYDYTANNGKYYIEAPNGANYNINPLNLSNIYTITCPASGNYTNITPTATGLDFAVECPGGFDLDGSLYIANLVPGWTSTFLNVGAYNNYCNPVIGVLKVVLDPAVTFNSASIMPTSISGDTLIWNPFTFSSFILSYNTYLNINIPTDTTAQVGDTACFTFILEPIAGDSDPANNVSTYCHVIQGSWDPNAKDVNPKGSIANNQQLDYTVMFQNTGTAPATNVYIIDTIDTNLDMLTFSYLGSSHPCEITFMGENIVKFYFHNINLPDSSANEPESHGFVRYSMSPKPGLINGTMISNSAAIYFDFNPAVITNTVTNVIDLSLGINEAETMNSIQIYPNPANNSITLETDLLHSEAVLTDISGRVLNLFELSEKKTELDVSHLINGIYFIQLNNSSTFQKEKLVIMR